MANDAVESLLQTSVINQNVVNELETEIEEERRQRGWFGTIT